LVQKFVAITKKIGILPEIKSPFLIELDYQSCGDNFDRDFLWMSKIPKCEFLPKRSRKRNEEHIYHGLTTHTVTSGISRLSYEDLVEEGQCPPPPATACNITEEAVGFNHSSVYVGGRYNKFMRGISNSPWWIGGKLKVPESMEAFLSDKLVQLFDADSHKFSSAGREDVGNLHLLCNIPFMYLKNK
jgi:hypothetical protein